MAVINTKTGYHGFTTDGLGKSYSESNNGRVKACIFAIRYPYQHNDVDFTISNGINDWGAQMGDGSTIPLYNPVVLFTNKDHAIVKFEMTSEYPSNSPCILVYRSDTASMHVTAINDIRPFTINSVTGNFAFTTEGYGGTPAGNGYVNRLIATILYHYQYNDPDFTITTDPSHWGVRMGDDSIINLRNPQIISVNRDNAVVVFEMDTWYPSNSPCILVYRSPDASYTLKPVKTSSVYKAVTNITGVPTSGYTGTDIDLSAAAIEPIDATNKIITWSIVSGNGTLTGEILTPNTSGNIVIEARITKGATTTSDYTKRFTISIVANVITITSQPNPVIKISAGNTDRLSVIAKSTSGILNYQWYTNTSKSYTGATAVSGVITSSYNIPSTISNGTHYMFCEVSSPGATSVRSNISTVNVIVALTGIKINQSDLTVPLGTTNQLTVSPVPSNATLPSLVWSSNNTYVTQVSSNGLVTPIDDGTAKITVKTADGKFSASINITVPKYVSVTNISNVISSLDQDTNYTLTGTVEPSNATYKTITWSLVSAGTTGATVTNGVLRAPNTGIATIRATVVKGLSINSNFTKDFIISITKKFVAVVSLDLVDPIKDIYSIQDKIILNYNITPSNATYKNASFSIVSGPGKIENNSIVFTGAGTIVVKATVINGLGTGRDYTKQFSFKCNGLNQEIVMPFIGVIDVGISFTHTSETGSGVKYTYINDIYDPFEDGSNPSNINYVITPINATNRNAKAQIISISSKDREPSSINNSSYEPSNEFINSDGWVSESNSVINISNDQVISVPNINNLKEYSIYKINLKITISKGTSETTDLVKNLMIFMFTPVNTTPFYALKDIELVLPNPLRLYYPILITRATYTPESPSATLSGPTNVMYTPGEIKSKSDTSMIIYTPDTYDIYHTVEPLKIFEWNYNDVYLYTYNPGKISFGVYIEDATVSDPNHYSLYDPPPKIPFMKDFTNIEVLPPFEPVRLIKGIPTQLPSGVKYQLTPELSTEGGLKCYNPCWDEDTPTNTSVIWSLSAGYNNTGITITSDGIVTIASSRTSGKFGVIATVKDGTAEHLEWYGKVQESVDYTQTFEIEVAGENKDIIGTIELGLSNGNKVSITKMNEMSFICSDQPSNASITLGSKTFKKSDVTTVTMKDFISASTDETFFERFNEDKTGATINVRIIITDSVASRVRSCLTYERVEGDTKYCYKGIEPPTTTFAKGYVVRPIVKCDNEDDILYYVVKRYSRKVIIGGVQANGVGSGPEGGINGNFKDDEDGVSIVGGFTSGEDVDIYICNGYSEIESSEELFVNDISLKNFCRNFTNLTSIVGDIPYVTGEGCMENFLMGCSKFNKPITIPDTVTGKNCLKQFMRDCTSFNNTITIPDTVTGEGCMHGFLYGCTSYNKAFVIPDSVTGKYCLRKFMYGCTSFNSSLTIARGVEGVGCMMHFLGACPSFNQPLILPDDVGYYPAYDGPHAGKPIGRQLNCMLEECNNMCSTITVPKATGSNANLSERSFSTFNINSNAIKVGITFDGEGATDFCNRLNNNYEADEDGILPHHPYRHITNIN